MRVVVGGATGFIGVRLVEQLHSLGHTAIVLVRDPQKRRACFPKQFFQMLKL